MTTTIARRLQFLEIQTKNAYRLIRIDLIAGITIFTRAEDSLMAIIIDNDPETWSVEFDSVDEAILAAKLITKFQQEVLDEINSSPSSLQVVKDIEMLVARNEKRGIHPSQTVDEIKYGLKNIEVAIKKGLY